MGVFWGWNQTYIKVYLHVKSDSALGLQVYIANNIYLYSKVD